MKTPARAGARTAGLENPSVPLPATSEQVARRILDLYGARWTLALVRLSEPDADGDDAGKAVLDTGWKDVAARRRSKRINAERVAESMADHVASGGNIGLVVPAGIVVVDCDSPEAVARLDNLDSAPVQCTARGKHFWFRVPMGLNVRNWTRKLVDGVHLDFKTLGGQVVVEPSIHATGAIYEWRTCLPADESGLPLLPSWIVEALTGQQSSGETSASGQQRDCPTGQQQDNKTGSSAVQSKQSEHSTLAPAEVFNSVVQFSPEVQAEVDAAIAATLPEIEGQRNHRIFTFASRLKAIVELANAAPHAPQLRLALTAWHRLALPIIKTKDFDESWQDFIVAWSKARPHGAKFNELVQRARDNPDPFARALAQRLQLRRPQFGHLIALCCELESHHTGKPWPLSQQLAADAVGVDIKTARDWLAVLRAAGAIVMVTDRRCAGVRYAREWRLNREWHV